jgi:hypothetical protein
MSIFWLIPIGIAIAAFVWFLKSRDAKKNQAQAPVFNVDINTPLTQELFADGVFTPGGATVRALKSMGTIPAEALDAIDRGISHQIRNSGALHPDWKVFQNLSEYQLYLIDPMTHNVETDPGSPALIAKYLDLSSNVGQQQTAGTCIGVDGAIFIPGTGPSNDARYPSIVLPYEPGEMDKHASYFEESARNESEHIREWGNDKVMFRSFAIVGDVHPHFPDTPAVPVSGGQS